MANEVALQCILNVGSVPAGGGEQRLLYLLVDLRPGDGLEGAQVPVNLALVLDVSESMRLPVLSREQFEELSRLGQVNRTTSDGVPVWTFRQIPEEIRKAAPSNLEAVQASIAQSARHLEGHDRVSLVAFADRAETLLKAIPGSEGKQVLDAVASMSQMKLGDETNMAVGLQEGLEQVRRAQTVEMTNRVMVLTDGFTREPERVLSLSKEARDGGVSVSTLGIGTEFNEKLLVEMADASLGNAYFAPQPQDIPDAFAKELAAVQAVSLRDVGVEIKLSTGIEVRRAYRVRPATSMLKDIKREGRTLQVSMGDMEPANPPALLIELVVPPQSGGTFRVARVSVLYAGKEGERVQAAASDVVLNYVVGGGRMEPNPLVMNTVERVTAYALQTRALDEMAAGNVAGATQKLRAAATRLLALGETDLAQAAEQEAARLSESGQASAESAKELRYATRRLTQRLG